MTDISTLKRHFLEHMEIEKGRSLRTLEIYDSYLTRFFEFSKIKSPKDITEDAVRGFRINLNRKPGARYKNNVTMSKRTQNHYLIALRVFLKFLSRKKIETPLSSDAIDLAKLPDRQIDVITHEELERLLSAPQKNQEQENDPVVTARDKAILEMLFSTGLRVSELCSLPTSVDLSLDEVSVRGRGSDGASPGDKGGAEGRIKSSSNFFLSML